MGTESYPKGGKTTHKNFGTEKMGGMGGTDAGRTSYPKKSAASKDSNYKTNCKSMKTSSMSSPGSTYAKKGGEKFGTGA